MSARAMNLKQPPEHAPRMRADAVRNRERVVQAARLAFAEQGADAQIEDVARRAGVGVGTVYRHFAAKEALIDAALVARFEQALRRTRASMAIEDPWRAVVDAFAAAAELTADDRCFCGMIGERLAVSDAVRPVLADLVEAWGELLRRAQDAGCLRGDVSAEDVPSLMCALANVVRYAPDATTWKRYVALMLDGLRAGATTPLPK